MRGRGGRWLLGASVLNLVFLYAPIVVLILFSFNASRLSADWQGFTLRWYRTLAADEALLAATWNSLAVATISTVLATVLGIGLAVCLDRFSPKTRRLVEAGLLLPLVIPEVMIGVALLLFFVLISLPLSLVTVTIGHVAINLPIVSVVVRARLRQLDPCLEEAARDLGATRWEAFRRVTLPLLAPALVGAMLLVFTLSLDDFVVTFFTAGPGATTLPLKVYSMVKSGVSPEINALSAIIVLLSMLLISVSLLFQRRAQTIALMPQAPIRGLVCLILIGLSACQPAPEDGPKKTPQSEPTTLYYFTWSDYVDKGVMEDFEKMAHVHVVVDTFGSNEELLAKLQSGATGYDVAVPSDFMVSILATQGLLADLELSKIPNVRLLTERLQHLPFDPTNRFSIPYLWGTVGIGYDSDRISTPPDSWMVLWDPRHKGRISMLNDQREVFGVALRVMGQSMNARDPAVIEQAKMKLVSQKPLVKTYTSENYDQLLASGEVTLAHGWGGAVARAMADRPSLKYVIPKEGGTIWSDCLVVLKSSPRKDLAMRFINYLLDAGVAARTTNRILFATSNREAKALVHPHIRQNPAVYPPDSLFDRLEWMADVGEAIRFYDRAWTELKIH